MRDGRQQPSGSIGPTDERRPLGQVIDFTSGRAIDVPPSHRSARWQWLVVAAIAVIAALAGLTWWTSEQARKERVLAAAAAYESRPQRIEFSDIVRDPLPAGLPDAMPTEPVPYAASSSGGTTEESAGVLAPPPMSPVLAAAPEAIPEQEKLSEAAPPKRDRRSVPVLVFDSKGDTATRTGSDGILAPTPERSSTRQERKETVRTPAAASLTRGTVIPAILETAINAELLGFVRAVVSTDVRSHDGAGVLVPRSSRLVGRYEGTGADARVVWTRLTRPDGTAVNLGAGAATTVVSSRSKGDSLRVRQGEPVRVFVGKTVALPE